MRYWQTLKLIGEAEELAEDSPASYARYLSSLYTDLKYWRHNFPMDWCEDFPASTLVAEGLGDGWHYDGQEGSYIFLTDWDDQCWRIPVKELRHFIELCNTSGNEEDFEPYKYGEAEDNG